MHVNWEEQGMHALSFTKQASKEQLKNKSEQLVMKLLKLPNCPERKCGKEWALENEAEQTWTSHHVVLLVEMTSVADDTLENHGRSLLSEETTELRRRNRQGNEHLQGYISRVLGAKCQKLNKKSEQTRG